METSRNIWSRQTFNLQVIIALPDSDSSNSIDHTSVFGRSHPFLYVNSRSAIQLLISHSFIENYQLRPSVRMTSTKSIAVIEIACRFPGSSATTLSYGRSAGINLHLTPLSRVRDNVICSLKPSWSKLWISEKACSNLATVYEDSMSANFCPGHILGPPLKGRYSHPGRIVSHLSGRNSSASGPKSSGRRCITKVLYVITLFFATNSGEFPSGPPPTGIVVSLFAMRLLVAMGGNKRSADRNEV